MGCDTPYITWEPNYHCRLGVGVISGWAQHLWNSWPPGMFRTNFPRFHAITHGSSFDGTFDGGSDLTAVANGYPKSQGWKYLRDNRHLIKAFGIKEGTLMPTDRVLQSKDRKQTVAKGEDHKKSEVVIVSSHRDASLIHSAIPFLPNSGAFLCLFLNFVFPGGGTILSGFMLLCMGQPRINYKDSRVAMSILVNLVVGIAQLSTITFLLVGYFWSIAWGFLLVIHSFEYKQALLDSRKEAVTTAAIEALTRDTILHRKDVVGLIKRDKEEKTAQLNQV